MDTNKHASKSARRHRTDYGPTRSAGPGVHRFWTSTQTQTHRPVARWCMSRHGRWTCVGRILHACMCLCIFCCTWQEESVRERENERRVQELLLNRRRKVNLGFIYICVCVYKYHTQIAAVGPFDWWHKTEVFREVDIWYFSFPFPSCFANPIGAGIIEQYFETGFINSYYLRQQSPSLIRPGFCCSVKSGFSWDFFHYQNRSPWIGYPWGLALSWWTHNSSPIGQSCPGLDFSPPFIYFKRPTFDFFFMFWSTLISWRSPVKRQDFCISIFLGLVDTTPFYKIQSLSIAHNC